MTDADLLIPVELYGENGGGDIVRYACGDNSAISKGKLLRLVDPRTASYACAKIGQPCAGVCSSDKKPGDGQLSVSCWTNAVFEAQCSMAALIGDPIIMTNNNYIMSIASNATTTTADVGIYASCAQNAIGRILEAGTDEETVNIRIKL